MTNRSPRFFYFTCIFLVFVIVGSFYVKRPKLYQLSQLYQLNIFSKLYPEDTIAIKKSTIPAFQLQFNVSKLSKALDYLKCFDYKKYDESNKRIKGRLIFESDTIAIKLKIHGKTPNYHFIENRYSINVKAEKAIFGLKHFRFIIYERGLNNPLNTNHLAKVYSLYTQQQQLVRLQINNQTSHLFYLESPLNQNPYKSLINVELPNHKSAVWQIGDSLALIEEQTEIAVNALKMPEQHKEIVKEMYRRLNTSLATNNATNFQTLFELDYITNFLVAKFIAGFNNHGFTRENLMLCIDTSNYKFYPFLHRDHFFDTFKPETIASFNSFYHPDGNKQTIQLLELLLKTLAIKKAFLAQLKNDTIHKQLQKTLDNTANKQSAYFSKKIEFLPDYIKSPSVKTNYELACQYFLSK